MIEDWVKCHSKSQNKPYWFNKLTKKSSWVDPNIVIKQEEIKLNESNKKRRINKIKVAVIVPFRDLHEEQHRTQHLNRFITEIPLFFQKNDKNNEFDLIILIIEQQLNDNKKFNRGKLLNIGFKIAVEYDCDIFIFHDVDLIPSDDLFEFYTTMPTTNPIHIAKVWNRYNNNPKYVGGIISFNKDLFVRINGFPNNFWGWGGEDDEMQKRMQTLNIEPIGPNKGDITDMEDMTLVNKVQLLRQNVTWKCMNKYELLKEHSDTWSNNGLNNLLYNELSRVQLNDKTIKITVDLLMNYHWTDEFFGLNDTSIPKNTKLK